MNNLTRRQFSNSGDDDGEGLMSTQRPSAEDRDALRILLQREDLSDYNAEFIESLKQWRGPWTEKQLKHFDQLCLDYFGAC